MHFNDLYEGEVVELPALDKSGAVVKISNTRGNHPQGVYAYRVDYGGRSAMYATDTEHYAIVDPRLKKLAQGVDVLIYDAQYTPEEYAGVGSGLSKTGWGHSTFEAAVELAKAAGVKQLVLFHHDPGQDDKAVREKERRAKELFGNTVAAYEGMRISLE
jgi:phosphoribosyl 1,2-cyclic phosphodiesterase